MARFDCTGNELALRFNPLETFGGLRRGARVPLADVASVEVVDDPWEVASGMRVGTGIPWVILLGTMVRREANDVVAIYGRSPAVVVHLRQGASWQRLIATVPDPSVVAGRIEEAIRAEQRLDEV